VSALATASAQWTNARLIADFDSTVGPPELIVLNPDDAPAELLNVRLLRASDGMPTEVQMAVHNRTSETLFRISIDVFVFSFDAVRGTVVLRYLGMLPPERREVLAGESTPQTISLKPLASLPGMNRNWRLVATLSDAESSSGHWVNTNARQKAEASLLQSKPQ
jgi:hypothetical protein